MVSEYLTQAKRIACLDWHTGLGEYGGIFPLCYCEQASRAWQLPCDWWGEEAVRRGAASWAPDGDNAPAPVIEGLTWEGLIEGAPHATIAGGFVEFGTVGFEAIVQGPILDHWVTFKAPASADLRLWRAQMRMWFAPRDPPGNLPCYAMRVDSMPNAARLDRLALNL